MSTPKRRKLYPHKCEGCGKEFFSENSKQTYCSRSCASTHKTRHMTGHYSVTAFSKKESAKKMKERNERLAERDKKAAAWLGNDAVGDTRGRVPGGCRLGIKHDDFTRWY